MDVIVLSDDAQLAGTSNGPSAAIIDRTTPTSDLEDWSQIISSSFVPEVCMMECGCCFGDTELEQMVQCGDGHLFCTDCLKRYADEAIHGQGKSQLLCMTADCGAQFPRSQMMRALTNEIIEKFDERVQEESLNMANLVNLVRCPDCNYAAEIVDEEQQVFVCPQCSKRSCRRCQADWDDHDGLTCDQVEKKDETSIRLKYEERMTEARVRQCPKCKAPLVKDGGCNRVTCRCGGTICYICRKPDISYEHFCQHPGPHNKGCSKCKSCLLWSSSEADEERIIEQLKQEGKVERVTKGFHDERDIGAPQVPAKNLAAQPVDIKPAVRRRLNRQQRAAERAAEKVRQREMRKAAQDVRRAVRPVPAPPALPNIAHPPPIHPEVLPAVAPPPPIHYPDVDVNRLYPQAFHFGATPAATDLLSGRADAVPYIAPVVPAPLPSFQPGDMFMRVPIHAAAASHQTWDVFNSNAANFWHNPNPAYMPGYANLGQLWNGDPVPPAITQALPVSIKIAAAATSRPTAAAPTTRPATAVPTTRPAATAATPTTRPATTAATPTTRPATATTPITRPATAAAPTTRPATTASAPTTRPATTAPTTRPATTATPTTRPVVSATVTAANAASSTAGVPKPRCLVSSIPTANSGHTNGLAAGFGENNKPSTSGTMKRGYPFTGEMDTHMVYRTEESSDDDDDDLLFHDVMDDRTASIADIHGKLEKLQSEMKRSDRRLRAKHERELNKLRESFTMRRALLYKSLDAVNHSML